eukprot:1160729-Pelagomonas_calceolata.AAC.8
MRFTSTSLSGRKGMGPHSLGPHSGGYVSHSCPGSEAGGKDSRCEQIAFKRGITGWDGPPLAGAINTAGMSASPPDQVQKQGPKSKQTPWSVTDSM